MKKKNLLYIVPKMNFFSNGYRGSVMHALGICEGFADNGWNVTIVGGNQIKSFKKDIPSSVRIVEINEPKGPFGFFLWRVKAFNTYLNLKNNNVYSVVLIRYVFSSFFLISLIPLFSSKLQKIILETNGFMSFRFRNIFIFSIERYLFNLFSLIYTVSNKQKNIIENLIKSKTKVVFIPNGCTKKKIKSYNNQSYILRKPRLVCFGTFYKAYNFNLFAKFINKLTKNMDIEIFILGDGPQLKFFKKKLIRNNKVSFHGKFSRNDLGILINLGTDILYLPEQYLSSDAGGISTKLFDYMSTKSPIIAPAGGELNSILFDNNNALLYQRGNFDSFYFCVKNLYKNSHLRSYLSVNSYNDFKKKYTWQIRMKTLINELNLNFR